MLFYETYGSTSLKHPHPLIFLHGFLGSRLDWIPIIERLKNHYCCITIDLPCHGNSKDFTNIFKSVETTLFSLKKPLPILIGYSLGGRLGLAYGQKHPKNIQALIAISSHIGLKTAEDKKKRALQDLMWQERLQTLSSEEFLALWYEQPVFNSLKQKPNLLKKLLQLRRYKNPQELSALLDQVSLANQPLYETFAHKTYFLFGEEDPAYAKLYETLNPSFVKKIKQAGHALHLENPEECIQAIELFALKSIK